MSDGVPLSWRCFTVPNLEAKNGCFLVVMDLRHLLCRGLVQSSTAMIGIFLYIGTIRFTSQDQDRVRQATLT